MTAAHWRRGKTQSPNPERPSSSPRAAAARPSPTATAPFRPPPPLQAALARPPRPRSPAPRPGSRTHARTHVLRGSPPARPVFQPRARPRAPPPSSRSARLHFFVPPEKLITKKYFLRKKLESKIQYGGVDVAPPAASADGRGEIKESASAEGPPNLAATATTAARAQPLSPSSGSQRRATLASQTSGLTSTSRAVAGSERHPPASGLRALRSRAAPGAASGPRASSPHSPRAPLPRRRRVAAPGEPPGHRPGSVEGHEKKSTPEGGGTPRRHRACALLCPALVAAMASTEFCGKRRRDARENEVPPAAAPDGGGTRAIFPKKPRRCRR